MKDRGLIFIFIILKVLFIQSCGHSKPLNIGTLPELRGGSLLGEIEPVTFVINKFEDKRADFYSFETIKETKLLVPFENVILNKYLDLDRNQIFYLREVILDRSISDIIVQMIASELRRNGHQVLKQEDSKKAEMIIDGTVLQYDVAFSTNSFFKKRNCYMANVKVAITVIDNFHAKKMLSKMYTGIVLNHDPKSFFKTYLDHIKWATLNMVKDFTTDQEFLNVLQEIKKPQSSVLIN